jgi:hypothetical protein
MILFFKMSVAIIKLAKMLQEIFLLYVLLEQCSATPKKSGKALGTHLPKPQSPPDKLFW